MAKATVVLDADTTLFNAKLAEAQATLGTFTTATMALNTALSATKLFLMGGALAMVAEILPTYMAANAVKDVEANIRRFAAVTGDYTTDVMSRVNELAIEFGTSAGDITEMMIEFGKAGFDSATIMNDLLVPALQLTKANQMDTATAAAISTNAWQLWGAEVGDFTQMANEMHVAANESLMDVEDLSAAFADVGAMAKLNNFSFEEFISLAGATSQIASHLGENFRSLFQKMFIEPEKLATVLGRPDLIKEGHIQLTVLIDALGHLNELSAEAQTELIGMWGLRPGTNFGQMSLIAEEYARILGEVNTEMGALPKAADLMNQSIQSIMTSLMESIVAPLRTKEVFDSLRNALMMVREALSNTTFQEEIQNIIMKSAEFVSVYGPQLVDIIIRLMQMIEQLGPTILSLANSFLALLDFVSKLPVQLLMFFGLMYEVIKLTPIFVTNIMKAAWATGELRLQVIGCYLGFAALMGGLMLIFTGQDDIQRWAGVVVASLSAVIIALAVLKGFILPWSLGTTALAVGGMVAIATGALVLATPSGGGTNTPTNSPIPSHTNANTAMTAYSSAGSTTNDNRVIYNYGVPTDTLQTDMSAQGDGY